MRFIQINDIKLAVINLQGKRLCQILMILLKRQINSSRKHKRQTPFIFVDFHAETTSEKYAMGWHLDGRASAVV
ncbi:YmdB family metallophosphoesterase, partial [Staphylococcus aureus]